MWVARCAASHSSHASRSFSEMSCLKTFCSSLAEGGEILLPPAGQLLVEFAAGGTQVGADAAAGAFVQAVARAGNFGDLHGTVYSTGGRDCGPSGW
jgi:hypothetical protein